MTFIAPREKLFGHLDRLHSIQTTGGTTAPINVEVDLSNRCSLGCEWCHFAFTHTRGPLAGKRAKPDGAISGGDLMETDLALRIGNEFAAAGVASITWTGGGEPTLHPHFDEIVHHTQWHRHAGLAQGLYTHGGHIDNARARLLRQAMTFVYVSLDASNPVAYKRDKGVDRFDAACDGIRRLANADGPATIGVGFLVTEQNWKDTHAAVEVAKRCGADYIQFRPTIRYDQDTPDRLDEDTVWMQQAAARIAYLADLYPGFVEADVQRFHMYRDWAPRSYTECWWSALQTVVTPNGKVWTCVNKREHPAAELGDLSVESFAEVWARQTHARVDADCRIMCRGHLGNLALDEIMADRRHPEFV